jgi:hypothetical protein
MIASEMSTNATAGPGPAAHACDHCDTSVPHEHLDVRAIVDTARANARRRAVTMVAAAAVVTVAAVVVTVLVATPSEALGALALTAAGYLVVTAVGVAVLGAARARTSDRRAVVLAGLVSAALAPCVALAVALTVGVPGAAVAGATWLLGGALAEAGRARTTNRLLLTEAGETARAAAVATRGALPPGTLPRWVAQGAFVALATWVLALVPLAVVALVPLAVALAALGARRAGA